MEYLKLISFSVFVLS